MSYNRKERWTAKQEQFMLENYETMKDEQIAEVLGRTLKSIRNKRQRLNLGKVSAGKGVVLSKMQSVKNNMADMIKSDGTT